MLKIFTPTACLLFFMAALPAALGQESAIVVDGVDFNTTDDDWVQMEIELTCEGNPNPEARSDRYVESIRVKAYLAYTIDEQARTFDFYTSEVEILMMEQGESYNVYFYLPGLFVERDRLKETPDFYFVEVEVGGELLPPQEDGMSSTITNAQVLESMKQKAEAGASKNEGILMPIYFAPTRFHGRVDDLPTFRRREPTN